MVVDVESDCETAVNSQDSTTQPHPVITPPAEREDQKSIRFLYKFKLVNYHIPREPENYSDEHYKAVQFLKGRFPELSRDDICFATRGLKLISTLIPSVREGYSDFLVVSIQKVDAFLKKRYTGLSWTSLAENAKRLLLADFFGTEHEQDLIPETPTTFMEQFNIFQSRCPAWKKDDSRDHQFQPYLFWESEEYRGITDLLAIRRQFSGLCYMHAPTMLQRYKVAAANKKLAVGPVVTQMLNVREYLRKKLEGAALENHFRIEDVVASSVEFLQQIANLSQDDISFITYPNTTPARRKSRSEEIAKCLQEYGPGLISSFQVEREFGDGRLKNVSFLGDMSGPSQGHHAMLLIGYRIDQETGDHVFLLQNWWHNRYFLEVSDRYLEQAHATCVFVKKDLSEIPKDFPVVSQSTTYAEGVVSSSENSSPSLDK